MLDVKTKRTILESIRGLIDGFNEEEANDILLIIYKATDRMLKEAGDNENYI